MSDIFLSYASADRDRAEVIAKVFSEKGWSVWWDRTIPPGKSFDEVIEKAIDSSSCIVVLWSNTSIASDWVKTEAAEGVRRKCLIPILIDEVTIPLEFRRIQAANLETVGVSSTNPELVKLFKSVSNITGKSPHSKHLKAEFIKNKKTSTNKRQPKTSENSVSKNTKQKYPTQTSFSKTRLKVLIVLQMAIIWIILFTYLFNDFISHGLLYRFITRSLVFWPIITGIWLTKASHSVSFRNGVILGWTTILGYAISWITIKLINEASSMIAPILLGISVLPIGYYALLRLRNIS